MKRAYAGFLTLAFCLVLCSGCGQAAAPEALAASSTFNADNPITVVSREEGSGTRSAFIELLGIEVKRDDGTKQDRTTKEATTIDKTDIMMTTVASDPYAIGYVSLGSLNDQVKALAVDGVSASAENVKNGTYTISRPFHIATKGEPTGLAKDFIDFILSREGQAVVGKSYIVIDDSAPGYTGSRPSGKLTVAGSSSVTPIMEKLKEAYAEINPNATVEIQMSDSSAGMTGAMEGTCDIGMASRELKASEKEQLTDLAIALDGIAVIVNPQNPLTGLSADMVRDIYIGTLETWAEAE